MGRKIYGANSSGLQQMFEPCSAVQSTQVIVDRDNNVDVRNLTVTETRPREGRRGGRRDGGGCRGHYSCWSWETCTEQSNPS